ncbi:hypothetical protein [Allocoleopsis franciscana]|uniref:Uncharacterized protein n=1 Tax=Allocoleopsis franciscana PCC 7113 TaxID=1173027 RepID=K9WRI7_9CYAN|nr:hypothetical protein [Allocoleopsis franciscana]AFZ22157.1 hypothetical protein Mic7113_6584 [Allocoleopsis franciscana PCC 7113]
MAGRSLQASPQGIEKAKNALNRNNLTQKALANERGIASWSTVNKFFNGRPVDRSIFIEICQELNLDWEEIVSPSPSNPAAEEPESEEPSVSFSDPLISTVQRNATRTRRALDPYILPRIRREALLEKCLKAIRHSLQAEKQNVIPIIGSAGYGKSTILGNIYDELEEELANTNSGWIALARCDDLIESVDTFATELGEKISGTRESIAQIAQQLNQQYGKGVLLLDTLDIVLTKPLVPVLRILLFELLESGTTLVFTCRDQDYSYFFEPYHESFAGFRHSVNDGCKIPLFNNDEVKQAAREFVKIKQKANATRSGEEFADKIIALSADSQSLQEITRNPLLLALLCDLFAQEENVPEDLTVSQLYAKYWDWKIAKVRKNLPSMQVCLAKEKLCLEIAEAMYKKSDERLRDSLYESNLNLDETEFLAYSELKSDGVIKEIGGKRIVFFHQTFLEYAIARWLYSTDSGECARKQLKNELKASQNTYSKYYIWAVFRQLLTLVSLSEFYQICDELDKTQLLPFRSVAFASVSRSEPESSSILLPLLAIALTKDYAYQEALLIAANSAPNRHGEMVWQIIVKLLEKVGRELINKTTEIAGELLTRLNTAKRDRFQQALDAVKNRTAKALDSQQELYHIYGQLIATYYNKALPHWERQIDLDVLSLLTDYYFIFGGNVRSLVVDLYLKPGVPELIQRELLLAIVQKPASEQCREKEKVKELLKYLLPNWLSSPDSPFGTSWVEALHTPLDKDWTSVVAGVVGQQAALVPDVLETLIEHLFTDSQSQESKDFNRCNLIAIQEAINSGASNKVASILLKIPITTLLQNRISSLSTLLREIAAPIRGKSQVDPELRLALAQWVVPLVHQHPIELIRVIDALATDSPPVQHLLGQLLQQLLPNLPQNQTNPILKKLSHIPEQLEPYLQQTAKSKESRSALLKIYQRQAEHGSSFALSNILQFCLDESIDVARDASWIILAFAEQHKSINVSQLLPVLARSKIVGVRQNCLKALIAAIDSGLEVTEPEILTVFDTLANEQAPEVVLLLYKLLNCLIWNHLSGNVSISLALAEAALNLTHNLVNEKNQKTLDMVAHSAFISLNQMTNLKDVRLMPQLAEHTRALLRSTDISRKIDKLVITGLLNKLAKHNDKLLEQIVRDDFVIGDRVLPVANMCAVAVAIVHAQGKNAPLLNVLLNDERLPEDVKSRILREQGV